MSQEAGKVTKFSDGSDEIIGACIEVHRHLGPGLLESSYEECLCRELEVRGLRTSRQVKVPLDYKGLQLDCSYRLDVLVEGRIIVEVKAVERLLPIHQAQILTYLKLTSLRTGLLVNFNVPSLRLGLRRLTHNPSSRPSRLPVPSSGPGYITRK